ncbi:MAG: hypothetical protein EXR68_06525 [Dehalococcoidia bacterium]|nr:hypothetical protein [Dehalococcoidia bacterium]
MSKQRAKVFCLEGLWSSRLTDRRSARPLLETLERVGAIESLWASIPNEDALAAVLRSWAQRQYDRYSIGYLAFHGEPGFIILERRKVSLDELAELIGSRCRGKVIYFGACETLNIPGAQVEAFRRATGAKAVVGYTKQVDWLESGSFELLLLEALTSLRIDAAERWMLRRHGQFSTLLGLKFVRGRAPD